jgi:hypothetical protein
MCPTKQHFDGNNGNYDICGPCGLKHGINMNKAMGMWKGECAICGNGTYLANAKHDFGLSDAEVDVLAADTANKFVTGSFTPARTMFGWPCDSTPSPTPDKEASCTFLGGSESSSSLQESSSLNSTADPTPEKEASCPSPTSSRSSQSAPSSPSSTATVSADPTPDAVEAALVDAIDTFDTAVTALLRGQAATIASLTDTVATQRDQNALQVQAIAQQAAKLQEIMDDWFADKAALKEETVQQAAEIAALDKHIERADATRNEAITEKHHAIASLTKQLEDMTVLKNRNYLDAFEAQHKVDVLTEKNLELEQRILGIPVIQEVIIEEYQETIDKLSEDKRFLARTLEASYDLIAKLNAIVKADDPEPSTATGLAEYADHTKQPLWAAWAWRKELRDKLKE